MSFVSRTVYTPQSAHSETNLEPEGAEAMDAPGMEAPPDTTNQKGPSTTAKRVTFRNSAARDEADAAAEQNSSKDDIGAVRAQ